MKKPQKPVSIKEIHEKAKEASAMTVAASHASKLLEDALNKVAELQAENKHLRDLLVKSNNSLIVNAHEIKPEEMVADFEIKRLREAAQSRPLSLEEAKIYQIMTNAKKTIRDVEEKEQDRARDVTNTVPIQELLDIAKSPNESN